MARFIACFPNRRLRFDVDKMSNREFNLAKSMATPLVRWKPFVHGFSLGFIRPEDWQAINLWARDGSVPGLFVLGTAGYSINWVEAVFGFNDRHAAFLFKMRWF